MDRAIRVKPGQITSLVEMANTGVSFGPVLRPAGILDEVLRRLLRIVQVPTSEDGPRYEEFTHSTNWDESVMIIGLDNPGKPANTPANICRIAIGGKMGITSCGDRTL